MTKLLPGRRNTHQKLKKKCFERDQYTCQLNLVPECKGDMRKLYERYLKGTITRKRAYISVDHTVPRSKGGKWSLANLRTACSPCNKAKGSESPE